MLSLYYYQTFHNTPMHIGIDASRYSNLQTKTGVEWYSYFLIPGLLERALADGHQVTLYTPHLIPDLPHHLQCILPFPKFWSMVRLSWYFLNYSHHPDVFFVPSHILPPTCPPRTVTTIHDIAFHYYPECYTKGQRRILEYGVRNAKKQQATILTVSESTKYDLIQTYQYSAEDIHVTPLGYNHRPLSTHAEKHLQQLGLHKEQYFLFLGRIEHKKNCRRLIEAFLKADLPADYQLVLVGKPGYGGEDIMKEYQHTKGVLFTGYLDNEQTSAVLSHATAVTIPSLYEGFCMPILEAYAHDRPVLTSNYSSMPEVAGQGALLVNPHQTEDIQHGLEQLATHQELRDRLRIAGRKQLSHFSWKQTIDLTYQQLLAKAEEKR